MLCGYICLKLSRGEICVANFIPPLRMVRVSVIIWGKNWLTKTAVAAKFANFFKIVLVFSSSRILHCSCLLWYSNFLFIPPPFANTAHSPSLVYLPTITHVLFFQNAHEMTSRRCVPGRVDSAKKTCILLYNYNDP